MKERGCSEEELAKEAKKYKRQQIFNAIGDGIMALSNLYFTAQGAGNMYDGANTLSGRARVRYSRLHGMCGIVFAGNLCFPLFCLKFLLRKGAYTAKAVYTMEVYLILARRK